MVLLPPHDERFPFPRHAIFDLHVAHPKLFVRETNPALRKISSSRENLVMLGSNLWSHFLKNLI